MVFRGSGVSGLRAGLKNQITLFDSEGTGHKISASRGTLSLTE